MCLKGKRVHKRTKAIHAGIRRSQYGEVSEAIFLTQGFVYDSAEQAEARFIAADEDEFIYARYGSPTVRMFEEKLAAIEGCEDAFACASGMAAVSGALMSCLKAGDHIVSSRALFGSCHYVIDTVLRGFGVRVDFVDGRDINAWRDAIGPDTKAVFFESVSNPCLEMIDIKAVSDMAHDVGALVIVDNVFVTPVFSNASANGADVIVYSATKHIDGQGRILGGCVLGSRTFIRETLEPYMKHTGGTMNPFSAWVLLKSLETLDLRVRAQAQTADKLAQALAMRTDLVRVIYPALPNYEQADLFARQMGGAHGAGGTLIALDVGSKQRAFKVLNALNIILLSNNLGDAKSLATHPATTTHQRMPDEDKQCLGITPGLIRVSVGLEDYDDLREDIMQALDQSV